jgi:hypothetical protein
MPSVRYAAMFLLCLTACAAARASQWVTFPLGPVASPIFVQLLAERDDIPGLRVEGYRKKESLEANCQVKADRPGAREAAKVNAANVITCTFLYADGRQGTLALSLAAIPVDSWGNQFEKWPVQFRATALTGKLYPLLKALYESAPKDPRLYRIEATAPTGAFGLDSYGVNRVATADSSAAFDCTQYWEKGKGVYDTRCLFLYFGKR